MSLPPSLLRIKRKAEDAPVDSLCKMTACPICIYRADGFADVQDEQHASKRHVGDQYFFRRVVEDGEAFAGPRIPEVKTAGPSPSQMRNGSSNEEGAVQSPSLDRSLQSRALRRFLLSKGDMPVTATGKRRRGGRVDNETVAVLVEDSNNGQADRLTRSKKVHTALDAVDSMNDQTDNIRAASPRRRRPGGSAAIPRAKTDDSKVQIQDHKTTELHEALQRYARDASSEETHRRTKLADADQDLSVTDVAMHANDDMDYVYDTYIRYGGSRASSSMDTMAAAAEGSVGLLVLTQEDQELWHTYQEDDAESEADWDSEQDDENGTRSRSIQRIHALMEVQRRTTMAPTIPRMRSHQMMSTATAHTGIAKVMARMKSMARTTTTTTTT